MKAIATYHSIDVSKSPVSVSPAAFRRHAAWFSSSGVRISSVEDLLAADDSERDVVALTFDDGYANVAAEAAPILADCGLSATMFVVTRHVGGLNAWNARQGRSIPDLPLLDWDGLGRLAEQGFTIASHTRTHRRLPGLERPRLEEEIAGAVADLKEHLGVVPRGFAYPYGDASVEVSRMVGCFHQWACTAVFDEVGSQALLCLPRLDMWYFEQPGLLESWGSPAFRSWIRRRRRARHIGSAIRRVVGRA